MTVKTRLSQAHAVEDQKEKTEQYKKLLSELTAAASEAEFEEYVDHILSEGFYLPLGRQLLSALAEELPKLPPGVHKAVATHTLAKVAPRSVSYPEQSQAIREALARVLEAEEEWTKAAQVLQGIDLDSGVRTVDSLYKLRIFIQIAMLYLEDEDPVSAETFIKKASSLIAGAKDAELELQYKSSYARIMDAKRRFIDAAGRYYELSSLSTKQLGGKAISEDDLLSALNNAITCTILAAAGPQRSRLLAQLYKDERSAKLPVYPFLEKVYLERILRKHEVETFKSGLKPHQLALLPDGSTVLAKAVMQHNLLSASKLYNNISVNELGTLLDVAPHKAEGLAADMIGEGRLSGRIDQVEGLIYFEDSLEQLVQWDKQVVGVCIKVDNILDLLVSPPAAAAAPVVGA